MDAVSGDKIHLSVVTAGGTVYERAVSYVNIPTQPGSVGILKGHAPMFCAVAEGILRCTYENGRQAQIAVGEGVANVANNRVTLLVSSARISEAQ